MTPQDTFATETQHVAEQRPAPAAPVLLDVVDLARVSGGSPKGGWQAAGAVYIDAVTMDSPKGGW